MNYKEEFKKISDKYVKEMLNKKGQELFNGMSIDNKVHFILGHPNTLKINKDKKSLGNMDKHVFVSKQEDDFYRDSVYGIKKEMLKEGFEILLEVFEQQFINTLKRHKKYERLTFKNKVLFVLSFTS